MGGSAIKNPRKVFSQSGIDDTSGLDLRITNLENNEFKILYYESVNTGTGTITKPTNSTIILDDFYSGLDAVVETISGGKPTGLSPVTAGGATITVSSFDTSGNYTLSGTPTSFPVAILYIIKIKALNYSNVNINNIIEAQIIDAASISYVDGKIIDSIADGDTTHAPSRNAVYDANASLQSQLNNKLTTIQITSSALASPADSTTYYFGHGRIIPNTTASSHQFKLPAGTIVGYMISAANNTTAGSNENSTLQLRNVSQSTSSSIGTFTTNATALTGTTFANGSCSIATNTSDFYSLQWDTPAWATNPANTFLTVTFYMQL